MEVDVTTEGDIRLAQEQDAAVALQAAARGMRTRIFLVRGAHSVGVTESQSLEAVVRALVASHALVMAEGLKPLCRKTCLAFLICV